MRGDVALGELGDHVTDTALDLDPPQPGRLVPAGRRPRGAEVAREEIFGPVITVATFSDEEAVRRVGDVPLGLSASVWTENARRARAVAARLDFGTVLDDYTRTKHVMHNHER
ncbi:aldehyde dehydrogenase family protein [Streptomyces sp. NPDC008137]|uniref:aldehyde dehydrogenase family protein n=1 Tax=Streptomyces sp. NPDC008137 TaxID=3364813 RepID=UPI0036EE3DA1